MYWALSISYWLVLSLAFPAAGLLVRIFIIQHDCGHNSFFQSRGANRMMGRLCSLMTLAPFAHWRRQHAMHHANWNNLDRRESGADIYSSCLTLAEYRTLSPGARRRYRIIQHPAVALLLFPPIIFVVLYRVPFDTPKAWIAERRSVWLTNGVLLLIFGALSALVGVRDLVLVQLPITIVASIIGVWLFSLQHRFAQVHWLRTKEWSYLAASLRGSSYLKLPSALQWLTGNIGFHHIHHLDPRIPNYRLEDCHRACPAARTIPVLTLREGLSASRYALWDEENARMIRFPRDKDCKRFSLT
jgi:omega-6 fatty acid desaturase (delta-12 desaturase)